MVLRSQHFVVDRELQLQAHRDQLKPDIIWNTEKGLGQKTIDGEKLMNYMGASMLNAAMTMASCPAVAVPAGFDQCGRPVGLQFAAASRGEARALGAAWLFEQLTGLDKLLPIDPKSGTVPPG